MFECQYNEEMQKEVFRLEAKKRAVAAGHPEWDNACSSCGGKLDSVEIVVCANCDQGTLEVKNSGFTGYLPNSPDKARKGWKACSTIVVNCSPDSIDTI